MYSTRAASGSRPLIPPDSVLPPPASVLLPPASVLVPPDPRSSTVGSRIRGSSLRHERRTLLYSFYKVLYSFTKPPDRRTYRARTRQGLLRLVLFGSPLASFV
ncbi:hypothetical protein LshimejAT787_1600080 [Lyophyllum shimeji]|uniref:Uncharacterized protein n=1 Tax=Lyophyllum shimeji TaxID=47721 RepID=A0A9P3USY2_LYOSH|nr:hypothetical protein LshimejAT787_1600080 [Lyophyllum shimeji]